MTDEFEDDPGSHLRTAASRADALLTSLSQAPTADSPMQQEMAAIFGQFGSDEYGDLGGRMIQSVAVHSGRYCALVATGVRELAHLIDGHAFVTLPPVVRSHIEFAARAVWLVEPIASDTGHVERAARLNLDLYTSICYQRLALNLDAPFKF